MFDVNQLLAAGDGQGLVVYGLTSAVFITLLCLGVGPLFRDIQHLPEEQTVTKAKARVDAEKRQRATGSPYQADAFPGTRPFKTVYGTIQVFEWGPEDGEKVLIVHGLATPCISMSNMAKELVQKGYRVMVFGK